MRSESGECAAPQCAAQCGTPGKTAPEVFSISVAQKGQLVGNKRALEEMVKSSRPLSSNASSLWWAKSIDQEIVDPASRLVG